MIFEGLTLPPSQLANLVAGTLGPTILGGHNLAPSPGSRLALPTSAALIHPPLGSLDPNTPDR